MENTGINHLVYDQYVSSNSQKAVKINNSIFIQNKPYFNWLIKKVKLHNKAINILDFGCGNGMLIYFLKLAGFFNLKGIDISAEQVAIAHILNLNEVEEGDGKSFLLSTNQSFDLIFLMDILEHFSKKDSLDLLRLVYQKLEKNGKIVIHVPNAEGFFGMKVRYDDLTHELCYTKASISQLLKIIGFSSIEVIEEMPVIHGIKSFFRRIIWEIGRYIIKLFYMSETGNSNIILSQNILVIAYKQ